MQSKRKSVIIKRILISLLFLVLVALIIPIPMNKVYDAVEIKLDDPSYLVHCQVKVTGKYHWNIFSDHMFSGQISVSDYNATSEKMSNVYFLSDGNGYPLEYSYFEGYDADGRPTSYTYFLGRLYSDSWFRKMSIAVYSDNPENKHAGGKTEGGFGGWGERDGYCIVPRATNREEALDILLKGGVIREMP